MMPPKSKKRQRVVDRHHFSFSSNNSSTCANLIDSLLDHRTTSTTTASSLTEPSRKLRRISSLPLLPSSSAAAATATSFNDPSTADVLLRLYTDLDEDEEHHDFPTSDVQIYLHSSVLRRAKYFSALLSDRWRHSTKSETETENGNLLSLKLPVSPTNKNSINTHITVLKLLYSNDLTAVITTPSMALDILHVALELLYEDCVRACVKFLEAVPWTEEEERRVVEMIPLLNEEESRELLLRVSPSSDNSCEEMLHGLIVATIHSNPNVAFVKAFVAKLLREISSRDVARRVLERVFVTSIKIVKESLEEYMSPEFRGDHHETEAMQRVKLQMSMTNAKHLLWLVERMIELGVADCAVNEWSEQASFTADLQRVFRDDVCTNIVPGLPAIMLKCTCKIANAVASGSILASRQVRMKLVRDWIPVLIICKDNGSPLVQSHKSLYLELEEMFLRIISTLPMSEAQGLLQQCLGFSTRNVDDCPHLVAAFNTWFRRAARPPESNKPW